MGGGLTPARSKAPKNAPSFLAKTRHGPRLPSFSATSLQLSCPLPLRWPTWNMHKPKHPRVYGRWACDHFSLSHSLTISIPCRQSANSAASYVTTTPSRRNDLRIQSVFSTPRVPQSPRRSPRRRIRQSIGRAHISSAVCIRIMYAVRCIDTHRYQVPLSLCKGEGASGWSSGVPHSQTNISSFVRRGECAAIPIGSARVEGGQAALSDLIAWLAWPTDELDRSHCLLAAPPLLPP